MKNAFLLGPRVYLRGLTEQDLSPEGSYFQWFNDPEVCRHNRHGRYPNSEAGMRAFFTEATQSSTSLVLAIVDREKDQHIGNVSLQNIQWIDRAAEFAVLVGAKGHWGKGFAKEAAQLLLAHGFRELNLNRIYCGTTEENIAMIRLAEGLGLKQEGRRRSAFYRGGKFLDVLEFSILRSEFTQEGKKIGE